VLWPPSFVRRLATALVFALIGAFATGQDAPLKAAVYDAPAYGHLEPDGSIDRVSVDLWRRAAESLGRQHRLVPIAQMEDIVKGLERKGYDLYRRDHAHRLDWRGRISTTRPRSIVSRMTADRVVGGLRVTEADLV
jgi:hypothetical protein